ncbi:hypothetical protein CY34DRAFT_807158 [Suillus luteus UH-Slu-Lm8-n1]|uniref:Uncharacterized protein n=1 Tax=Suillus luteus UH-Slu-Lm8-n1 TaxID=930992 RepID=A0A0D0AR48_9AGAM|nr:hypothetical protein CY34DRAFT_807158 [Suillus luteus UH-Slu-Lm8-n1]
MAGNDDQGLVYDLGILGSWTAIHHPLTSPRDRGYLHAIEYGYTHKWVYRPQWPMLSLHVARICDSYHLQTPSLSKSGSVRFSGKFSGRQTKLQVQVQLFGRTLDQMPPNQVEVNSWGTYTHHSGKGGSF